ncbi:MAG: HlyD family type I secretion periplasmic adaptor subunit [Pseudomonadota bacterium]
MTSTLSDRSVFLSAVGCAVGLGGFLLWAGFAGLDEGVTASGFVVVENDRKVVQHLEGGIVRTLSVIEGQRIEKGETLLTLEPVQSEAARDETAYEAGFVEASLARLEALRTEQPQPDWSDLEAMNLSATVFAGLVERQTTLFTQQRETQTNSIQRLESRSASLEGRARDLRIQITATESAIDSARRDLNRRRALLDERLETIGNVEQLEREVASLESELARLQGDRNLALSEITETNKAIAETSAAFVEEISQELVDLQAQSLVVRERLRSTEDRLARTLVTAPQAGEVLNLAVTTVGGVVLPGEPIMEIVPNKDELIALVRLRPLDRDAVRQGQEVEAQLTAYNTFTTPRIKGEVIGVSADLIEDPITQTSYYEARIVLDRETLLASDDIQLVPGMPVDAFIKSGEKRTFLDYVLQPIVSTLSKGARMG